MSPNRRRTVAIVAALMLVTAVAVPAVAAAETSLSVAVDQDHETGDALVSVTDTGAAVENATVNVTADENVSYPALNGTHETDEDGTVVLPNPNETIDVTITATYDNVTETVETTLTPLSESLDVTVDQADGEDAVVNVTQYGDAVENATVNVTTDENVTYAALDETYETDENGTIVLPAPSDDLNVTVTATSGDLSAETDVSLVAPELAVFATQNDAGELYVEVTKGDDYVENATVDVESDDDYADDDTYTATDGTLTLPAPTENVTVTVTASDGDETATTTTTLTVQTDDNANNDFAKALGTFIEHMKSQDYEGPLGQQVSEFVHANNPASEKANGPPEHAGPNGNDAGDNETDGDDRRGPPEHAGANGDLDQTRDEDHDRDIETETETAGADDLDDEDDGDEEDVDGDEGEDDETEDDETEDEKMEDDEAEDDDDENESDRGPPEHANNA